MVTLFNQEHVTEIHEYNLAKEAHQEGRQEGIENAILSQRPETPSVLANERHLTKNGVCLATYAPT